MSTMEARIEKAKSMIQESSKIVVMLGVGTLIESGGENIWSSRECYRLEDLYHKTPDEMLAVEYYSTRRDKFFEFYKNEIASQDFEPASLYYDVKRLQESGKVRKIITQNIDGLHMKAGLSDVIELYGNINNNWCPHCGKKFGLNYIRASKGVPRCDDCNTPIRPGIKLYGESIANHIMTDAVNACEDADMILVLGTNMYDNMVKFCSESYKGNRLVLITKEEHYMDKYANLVIHDKVSDVLPKLF